MAIHSSILSWRIPWTEEPGGLQPIGLQRVRRKWSHLTPPAPLLDIVSAAAAAAVKSLQSCPTLCNPIDSSPPGSSIPGILQARILEWVAISFSSAWKWKVKVKLLSCIWLFGIPGTVAYQAPPSVGYSRHEYWSGLPLPSPIHKLRTLKLPEVRRGHRTGFPSELSDGTNLD